MTQFPSLAAVRRTLPWTWTLLLAACGGGGSDTLESTPLPTALSLSATAAQSEVAGVSVFTTSLGTDTSGYTLQWDFGDGTTSTGPGSEGRMTHRYEQPGEYTVTLTLTNSAGERRTSTMVITAGHFERLSGLVCSGPDRTGWCWQQPKPSGNTISDITFADAQNGWAVGALGQILKTVDGGMHWTAQDSGTTDPLTQVNFVDASTGWAFGTQNTVLRTTNGGTTWDRLVTGLEANYTAQHWVVNARTAVISTGGITRVTEDGGQNWRASQINPTMIAPGGRLWAVSGNQITVSSDLGATVRTALAVEYPIQLGLLSAASDTQAWVAGSEPDPGDTSDYPARRTALWQTADGGATWQKLTPSGIASDTPYGAQVSYLKMFADGTGWLQTATTLHRTADGGVTWQAVSIPSTLSYLFAVNHRTASDGSTLSLSSHDGLSAYRTTDGGLTWATYQVTGELGTYYPGLGLYMVGSSVLLNYSGRAYRSSDNGQTWQRVLGGEVSLNGTVLHSAWFFDARNGLALGSNGTLHDTADGGASWTSRSLTADATPVNPLVGKLQFLPGQAPQSQTGWMLRTHPKAYYAGSTTTGIDSIWRTSDGGKTWSPPRSESTFRGAVDFHFVDAKRGWLLTNTVVGGYNNVIGTTVQVTEDGGETWTQRATLDQELTSVQFLDSQIGVAVGGYGTIARTTDGGQHWVLRASGVTADLNRVRMSSDGTGWIAGDNGTLLRTSDGGITWRRVLLLPTNIALNDVMFSGKLDGWALGDHGLVLVTRDGGTTWSRQPTGTSEHLVAGHFVDQRTGWLVGSNGTILTTATSGR